MRPFALRAGPSLVALLLGCGPAVDTPQRDAEGGSTSTGGPASDAGSVSSPGTTETTSPPPTTTTTTTTSPPSTTVSTFTTDGTASAGDDSSSGPDTGNTFIIDPDGGVCGQLPDGTLAHCSQCDLWEQDCPQGEKCTAWSNDGSGTWNSQRCQPLAADPDPVGNPCIAEGSGSSGVDSCERGSMCWNVDPDTLEGTCVALCGGQQNTPTCDDPATTCVIANEGVLNLCLPSCDPIGQDCAEGFGCYPFDETFACIRENDPVQHGGYPHPLCAAGSFAVGDDVVSNCDDVYCCTSFCDLTAPVCSGTQECAAFFKDGMFDVGYCNGSL